MIFLSMTPESTPQVLHSSSPHLSFLVRKVVCLPTACFILLTVQLLESILYELLCLTVLLPQWTDHLYFFILELLVLTFIGFEGKLAQANLLMKPDQFALIFFL